MIVRYNGFLPDILRLTQASIAVWFDGIIIVYTFLIMYCIVFCFVFVWCPCVAINVSVQYNARFLPDLILLTRCYYHRGTRLNAMEEVLYF